MTNELLLTVGQAAGRLNLSERTGWNLVRTGRLPSVKIGKSRRVPATALERFVENLAEDGDAG
jgi:excisionase family DNA binding protein